MVTDMSNAPTPGSPADLLVHSEFGDVTGYGYGYGPPSYEQLTINGVAQNVPHAGLDIDLPPNAPVRSVSPGVVNPNYTAVGREGSGQTGIVGVTAPSGETVIYEHVVPGSLSPGQHVRAGQVIGTVSPATGPISELDYLSGNRMGYAGFSDAPHVHFQVDRPGYAGVAAGTGLLYGASEDPIGYLQQAQHQYGTALHPMSTAPQPPSDTPTARKLKGGFVTPGQRNAGSFDNTPSQYNIPILGGLLRASDWADTQIVGAPFNPEKKGEQVGRRVGTTVGAIGGSIGTAASAVATGASQTAKLISWIMSHLTLVIIVVVAYFALSLLRR